MSKLIDSYVTSPLNILVRKLRGKMVTIDEVTGQIIKIEEDGEDDCLWFHFEHGCPKKVYLTTPITVYE
jgi:hypothetical protein